MKPIVLVTWLDAQDHADTWVDAKAAEQFGESECRITSVGFLISKTEKYVTLGGDWDEVDSDYGCVRKIPTRMIQEIKELPFL